ncbi:MAG: hypothetical protein M1470_07080 [Bacteroidetes bacterium]|nr:hypothetical protein [Bacteroidota bacterium]
MAKTTSFAEKAAKAMAGKKGSGCPKCGEILQNVLVISAEKNEKASYRYNQRFVKVCKCNEKEVYA